MHTRHKYSRYHGACTMIGHLGHILDDVIFWEIPTPVLSLVEI